MEEIINVNSILVTSKIFAGMTGDYEPYDNEIIMLINSWFLNLKQLGVGPDDAFTITGYTETWDDFFDADSHAHDLEAVKTYMGLKVKSVFDPTASATVKEAIDAAIAELEWRMITDIETPVFNKEE